VSDKTAEIELIANIKQAGYDEVADSMMKVLEDHRERFNELERKDGNLEEALKGFSHALEHFAALELKHYTEVKDAFPNGDPIGHRMFHEKRLRAAEAEEDFWRTMKKEIVAKGLWGIIIFLGGLVLMGVSVKFGINILGN
jgi:hypothetical protein